MKINILHVRLVLDGLVKLIGIIVEYTSLCSEPLAEWKPIEIENMVLYTERVIGVSNERNAHSQN